MFCQRVAGFKVGKGESRFFCCKDHLVTMVTEFLIDRNAGTDVEVALHPLVNEEPCNFKDE